MECASGSLGLQMKAARGSNPGGELSPVRDVIPITCQPALHEKHFAHQSLRSSQSQFSTVSFIFGQQGERSLGDGNKSFLREGNFHLDRT